MQKHLQLRMEAQGKYMQNIMEKARQTLTGENMASGSYKGVSDPGVDDVCMMKDLGFPINFPSLQDLHIYAGEQLNMPQQIDRFSTEGVLPINDNICLGNKRTDTYSNSSKSPLSWAEELQLQELGMAAACVTSQGDAFNGDMLHSAPSVIDSFTKLDALGADGVGKKKPGFYAKLERPPPRRVTPSVERMNPMIMSCSIPPPRNLSCG